MSKNEPSRRIHVLREDISRKIAAGEVIDRPFSVVRELLDNSLDAEARNIGLSVEEGGLARVRVSDDGIGMTREDLELCFLSYSTSKIREEADLYRIATLGFRGEALSSIGTCARLEITSRVGDSAAAHRLTVQDGKLVSLEVSQGAEGTVADVSDLFAHMPARRAFLKSRSAETSMCRNMFLDKALPFPSVTFRLFVDGSLKLFLPEQNRLERVRAAYASALSPSAFDMTEFEGEGFSAAAVLGNPGLVRRDRRFLQIFINRRRIFSYPLIQAVEYAYSPYVPGGSFPAAFVFLQVDPELVDFNVHPAKKEARIRNQQRIHQTLVNGIRDYLGRFSISLYGLREPKIPDGHPPDLFRAPAPNDDGSAGGTAQSERTGSSLPTETERLGEETLRQGKPSESFSVGASGPFRYLGQVFNLFLVVEGPETLYLIDQHAAHEKILYDRLRTSRQEPQELLFPINFDVSEEEEQELTSRLPDLAALGIHINSVGGSNYEISALPPDLLAIEETELVDVLKQPDASLQQLEEKIYSLAACRAAVKDGEEIDPITAGEIIRQTLGQENARCPHGRPIWHQVTREELYRYVMRT